MAEEQDKSQKTEEATPKRLQEALKKGQTVNSREVNSFFMLLALTFLITLLSPGIMSDLKLLLSTYVTRPDDFQLDKPSFTHEMTGLLISVLKLMTLPIVLAFAAVFFATLVQNRFVFSLEPIKPKLEKISVIKGFGRLFSRRSLVEFVKGIVKISIVGAIAMVAIWPYKEHMRLLQDETIYELLRFIGTVGGRMMIGICCVMFFIAIIDFLYQRFEYLENLKMSKQDIKEEHKQQEGDPLIKQRLAQIRRDRLRRSIMEAVPRADVVITNPTHYAIALEYDSDTMRAPVICAMGTDKVAQRIRELAEVNEVPIVRNPPLARILYDNGEVDEEIPYDQYKAVAEVISYVYRLKGKTVHQGI